MSPVPQKIEIVEHPDGTRVQLLLSPEELEFLHHAIQLASPQLEGYDSGMILGLSQRTFLAQELLHVHRKD